MSISDVILMNQNKIPLENLVQNSLWIYLGSLNSVVHTGESFGQPPMWGFYRHHNPTFRIICLFDSGFISDKIYHAYSIQFYSCICFNCFVWDGLLDITKGINENCLPPFFESYRSSWKSSSREFLEIASTEYINASVFCNSIFDPAIRMQTPCTSLTNGWNRIGNLSLNFFNGLITLLTWLFLVTFNYSCTLSITWWMFFLVDIAILSHGSSTCPSKDIRNASSR